ncbi:MAG: hypothetical protein Q9M41_08995 [Paracoccaceae bacterium]|nr:hypothetical protein [Paracoccaceae bacterium]
MVISNKILTVTYGTFSCTLEGFDDPFTTLQMVAEYFRKLAAEDRYFGAVPQAPDPEAIKRIAEKNSNVSIEAEIGSDGVILRPTADEPSDDEGEAMPAPAAEAGESVVDIAQMDSDDRDAAPEMADITAAEDMAVAEELQQEQEQPRESDAPGTIQADDTADTAPKTSANLSDDPFWNEEDTTAPAEAQLPEETTATIEGLTEQPAPEQDEPAEASDEEQIEAREDGALAEEASDIEATEATAEAETADEAVAEASPEQPETTETAPSNLAFFHSIRRGQRTAPKDLAAESAEQVQESAIREEEPAAAQEETATTADVPAEAADEQAEIERAVDAAAAATASTQHMTDTQRAVAEALAAIRRNIRHAEQEAEDTEDAMPEGVADLAAPAEPAETTAEEPESPQADASEQQPEEVDSIFAPAPSEEAPAQEDVVAIAETHVDTPAEPEPAELAATAEKELEPEDILNAELSAEEARRARVKTMLASSPDSEERELDRLLQETGSKMDHPEQRRRMSALDQLKAAVAATEAERMISGKTGTDNGATDLDEYREDLRRTQPETIQSAGGGVANGSGTAPETSQPPLILVSEQRIDTLDNGAEDHTHDPQHEVAETNGNLALKSDMRVEPDDDGEIQGIPADAFREATSFADFAERIGAFDLPDLLEAAAAYTAIIEKKERFSRAQVMAKVAKLNHGDAYSKEAGLRAFGKLLREGKILRVQDGQFGISKASRFSIASRYND